MSKIKKETTQLEAYCINVVKVLCKTEDQITEMQDIVGDARENLNKITGMTYED